MGVKIIGKGIGYTSETDISDHILLNYRDKLGAADKAAKKELAAQVLKDYDWQDSPTLFGRKSRIVKVIDKLTRDTAYGRKSLYTSEDDICRHILAKHVDHLNDNNLSSKVLEDYKWTKSSVFSSAREKRVQNAIDKARYFIKMQQCSEIRKDVLGRTFHESNYKLFNSEEIDFFQKYTHDLISPEKPVIPVSDLSHEAIERWDNKIAKTRDIDKQIEDLSKKEFYNPVTRETSTLVNQVDTYLSNKKAKLPLAKETIIGREPNAALFLKDEEALRRADAAEQQIIAEQNQPNISSHIPKYNGFFQSVGNLLKKYRIADIALAYTKVFADVMRSKKLREVDLDSEKISKQVQEKIKTYAPSEETLNQTNAQILEAKAYDEQEARLILPGNFYVTETVARDLVGELPKICISGKEIVLSENKNEIHISRKNGDYDSETAGWLIQEKNLSVLESLRKAIRGSDLPKPDQAEDYAFIAFNQMITCRTVQIVNKMLAEDEVLKDYSLLASYVDDNASSISYNFSEKNSDNPSMDIVIHQKLVVKSADSATFDREVIALQIRSRFQVVYDRTAEEWKMQGPFLDGEDGIQVIT